MAAREHGEDLVARPFDLRPHGTETECKAALLDDPERGGHVL